MIATSTRGWQPVADLLGYRLARARSWTLRRAAPRRLRIVLAASAAGAGAAAGLALSRWLGWMPAGLVVLAVPVLALAARRASARARLGRLLREARAATAAGGVPAGGEVTWEQWDVAPATRRRVEAERAGERELVLGRIDADGRLLSELGEFPGFEPVTAAGFLRRRSSTIDLVLANGKVMIRKDYHGDRRELIGEWHALARLQGAANVAAVHAVDEGRCLLYRSLAPGETVNDLLVRAGARIRLAQTEDDESLHHLAGEPRLRAILARGTALVPRCLSEHFLEELERQVRRIHARGVTDLSLTFGNVVVDRDRDAPWFFDFGGARSFRRPSGCRFAYRRARDRLKLNQLYGRAMEIPGAPRR